MSILLPSDAGAGGQRAIVAAALTATYMQAVNISLPNAALPHIQGTLSMSLDEVGWVFTAYMGASGITMPLAGWLAGRFGRKALFQFSLAAFALGLVLDTLAATTGQFVLARILQGAASGPLAPLSVAILLDTLPPARHARINMAAAITMLAGISTGASIGGWLSEYHGWRSIFYFSLPLTGFVFLIITASLPEKKAAAKTPFDFFGWGCFSAGLIGLQLLLDRGERLEWFSSAEIWAEALASILGFYLFTIHVVTAETHFLNKAIFRDRNFVLATIMIFAAGFVLLPTLALTSPMLEELLGYPVDTTGYMTLPRGAALVATLVLMGFAPARIDSRLFAISGMALVAYANWLMLGYSPKMNWRMVATAGVLQGAGLGIMLPALTKAAFATLDPKFRAEGTVLFNLLRLYGSTMGIAVVQLFFYNNTQAMHLALVKHLTPCHAAAHVTETISRQSLAALNEAVMSQASFVAVLGQFKILMIAMLIVIPLALALSAPRRAA